MSYLLLLQSSGCKTFTEEFLTFRLTDLFGTYFLILGH